MFTVYKATNRTNGKCYIGITSRSAAVRWNEHLSRARCGVRNSRLYAAIRKYGDDVFDLEVVAKADTEDAVRELERQHISKSDSYAGGYNCNLGGVGFIVFPKHIREKISMAQKGKTISLESRRKMSLAKLGKPECAAQLGKYTEKGSKNPRANKYLIQFPDGSQHEIIGLRAFCREFGLNYPRFTSKGGTNGYRILRRFNDHPERE